MSSWLTFVIGIILGLLVGWLIDLFYRRRAPTTPGLEPVEPEATPPAWVAPPAEAAAEAAIPPAAEEAPVESAGAEPDDTGMTEPPSAPEPLLAPEAAAAATAAAVISEERAPEEGGQEAEWPVIAERVGEVANETESAPAAAPHISDELPAPEALPPEAVEALAPAVVAAGAVERAAAPVDAHDKLIIIEGIGPAYEAKLRAAGINTFQQLAETRPERLREIIQPQSWQHVSFADWIEQAQLAAEGKDEELKALQARLFSRKK
jgi:predicted flap endonuclease-1-like 5' DNA nuclease